MKGRGIRVQAYRFVASSLKFLDHLLPLPNSLKHVLLLALQSRDSRLGARDSISESVYLLKKHLDYFVFTLQFGLQATCIPHRRHPSKPASLPTLLIGDHSFPSPVEEIKPW
jgi:hypothetical protein